jgi:hypothetical protein
MGPPRFISFQSRPATIAAQTTEREVMSKMRRLVLTVAALGALAVGGAAFAQAQNSGSSAPPPAGKGAEVSTPGDPADAPSAEDQQESDGKAGEAEDGGPEGKAEKLDTASGKDLPEEPNDQPDSPGQETGD